MERGIFFLINFVEIFSKILVFAIFARVIMSWVNMGKPTQGGRITQILHETTDPVINLVRKIPHRIGMIDLAPLIAIIGIDLISSFLIILLSNAA